MKKDWPQQDMMVAVRVTQSQIDAGEAVYVRLTEHSVIHLPLTPGMQDGARTTISPPKAAKDAGKRGRPIVTVKIVPEGEREDA